MKRRIARMLGAIALGASAMFGLGGLPAAAQQVPAVPDVDTLTQGPVHEAFAEPVDYDPAPTDLVAKQPPAAIEELPPDQRPDGDPIWIPGYWHWDAERADFIWISGIWRIPPPECDWVPGYWSLGAGGWIWTPGFWQSNTVEEVAYMPEPPRTLEVGPSSPAPSDEYVWTPGCWIWVDGRYVWRPGYWMQARVDWVWVPATWVWTPRGYVYVDGYWDYSLARRGVLFAPVYIQPAVYTTVNYVYTPTVVVEVNYIQDCLFIHPRHHHYYFGDYYVRAGFVAWFDYGRHHRHHDHIYVHERWRRHHHDHDNDWEDRLRRDHDHRTRHVDARPPRHYSERNRDWAGDGDGRRSHRTASSIREYSERRDSQTRFTKISDTQRHDYRNRGREYSSFRSERARIETGKRDDRSKDRLTVPNHLRQNRAEVKDAPSRPERGRSDRVQGRESRNDSGRSMRDDANAGRKRENGKSRETGREDRVTRRDHDKPETPAAGPVGDLGRDKRLSDRGPRVIRPDSRGERSNPARETRVRGNDRDVNRETGRDRDRDSAPVVRDRSEMRGGSDRGDSPRDNAPVIKDRSESRGNSDRGNSPSRDKAPEIRQRESRDFGSSSREKAPEVRERSESRDRGNSSREKAPEIRERSESRDRGSSSGEKAPEIRERSEPRGGSSDSDRGSSKDDRGSHGNGGGRRGR